jgi:hypothetical protein
VVLDRQRSFRALLTLLLCCGMSAVAFAQNQTADTTPVQDASSLPFQISLQQYDFGAADLPTLQSFAAGVYDGKWVLVAGRTNGLHGFGTVAAQNFPTADANKDIWVIDPISKQSWHRSLTSDATVSAQVLAELSSTNTEYSQLGNRLYVVGGYGSTISGTNFTTQSSLTAIDLPGMVNWVMTGAGSATANMRVVRNNSFRVTGGAMYELNGKMQLVFGQNFIGGYTPGSEGAYTNQVRSFNIVDDGTTLSVANLASTPANTNYHRRDLNVFPTVVRNPDTSLGRGLVALSGVFTDSDGAWTVPVVIDGNGNPSMADPNLPGTFKQGMNGYHSAKLGMYSESAGAMHEVLFGGISLQYHDSATNTFVTDNNLPFINDITSIKIDAAGNFSQHLLGEFPQILDMAGNRLRFGANAEFFLADGIPTYDNGVIKLDALTEPTTLGYIFGGLFANAPNTRGVPGALSGASNDIFEVVFTPVPEPAAVVIMLIGTTILALRSRKRRGIKYT